VAVISGLRRNVAENCAILGYYAETTYRPLDLEDLGTDRLSRNVGKELPFYAA